MDGGGSTSFIGYYVSLQCDNGSTYEGEVSDIEAERQLITLSHAHIHVCVESCFVVINFF